MSTAEDNAILQIAGQRTFASNLAGLAQTQLLQAMQVALGLGTNPNQEPLPTLVISPPGVADPGPAPTFKGVEFNPVLFSESAPAMQPTAQLDLSGEPGAVPDVPFYVAPGLPTLSPVNDELLLQIPTLDTDIELPEPPDLLAEIHAIAKPDLIAITLPDSPEVTPPEFLGVRPTDPGPGPTNLDGTMRTQYDSIAPVMRGAIGNEFDAFLTRVNPNFHPAMDAIEVRLTTYLNGGTALTPAVQDQIVGRSQAKVDAEARRAKAKINEEAAARGFSFPSVALLAQVQQADQAGRDNNAQAASDLAIKLADMEQANLQFALNLSKALREMVVQSGVSYTQSLVTLNGQALDYAKSVVENIVRVYELAIRYAETQARLYEAEARVYEAKWQGAMQVVAVYKAKIDGELAKAQVNTALVAEYRALLESVQSEAEVYKSQVEFVTAKASIEKLKVDLYDAKARGVIAQVNANSARWEGYKAAVDGAIAPQTAAAERVRAYSAQASAYGEIIRARSTAIDSAARNNESLVRVYSAKAEVNRTLNGTLAEVAKAEIDNFDTELKAYLGKVSADAEHSRVLISQYDVALRGQQAQVQLILEQMRERDTLLVERTKAVASIAADIGRNFAQVASAAEAGLNSLISVVANDNG